MNLVFRNANKQDKEFILQANKEINVLSGLNDSMLKENIDKDIFLQKKCKCIIGEVDKKQVAMCIYSNIYWANLGNGIYLSQVYVDKEFRKNGILKDIIKQIEDSEKDSKFITCLVGEDNPIMQKSLKNIGAESSDLLTYYKVINR